MAKFQNTITGIEIGTSAIKLIMGEAAPDGTMTVLGFHEARTQGKVTKGDIANFEAVGELLAEALNKLEANAHQKIRRVCVAITGHHVGAVNAQSSIPITSPDRIITEQDADNALRHAEAYNLPIDKRILHLNQKPYVIDGLRHAVSPEGMVGNQLTANVHIVYGNANAVRTVERLVDDVLGRQPDELVFTAIADYHGLGIREANRGGVLIVDIGAGVTEYALVFDDTCVHSGQVTVGTDHLANDLSIGLHLPLPRCREILRHDANARHVTQDMGVTIQIETMIGHPPRVIPKSAVEVIVESRLTELFEIIRDDLTQAQVRQLIGDRIILCGGGAAIPDACALAEGIFHVPVMIGRPTGISGGWSQLDDPRMVTPIGLLFYAHFMSQMRESEVPSFWQILGGECIKLGTLVKRSLKF